MISRRFKRNPIKSCKMGNIKRIQHIPWLKLILLLIISAVTIYIIFVRPSILTIIKYQGKIFATNTLTEVIEKIIADCEESYSDFIIIEKDNSGNISSVKTDGIQISQLKNNITKELTAEANKGEKHTYSIALGTLLSNELLLGKGPPITLEIVPTGYAEVNLISRFEEAGINQTKHSILIRVTMRYTAVVPLCAVNEEITSDYPIVEQIIIGKVPQYYASLSESNGDKKPFYQFEK